MKAKAKKNMTRIALVLLMGAMVYWGYATYQLIQVRNALTVELENEKRKFKVLQRKYVEEKALSASLQRAKLAAEGQVRQAQQAAADAEAEKKALEEKVAGMEEKYQLKTAKLEERIAKYAENLEKLIENRDQYKAKLFETVAIVKERNQMIHKLTAQKDELTSDLLETRSGLRRCEKHNVRLCKLTEELADSYYNKSVGASLMQAEPFTQLKKVEMEKLVQKYKDRIDDNNLELVKPSK